MLTRCMTLLGLIAALSMALSCSGTSGTVFPREDTLLERNWGRSYEAAKYNQILNPEAGKMPDSVDGMDGQAADVTSKTYRKTFEKEPPEKYYNLNLGIGNK